MVSKTGSTEAVRLGIAHHLGWAVAVAASADHEVLIRRRALAATVAAGA